MSGYQPRAGSVACLAMQHIRDAGGSATPAELGEKLGIRTRAVYAYLRPAIDAGVIRLEPGYTEPAQMFGRGKAEQQSRFVIDDEPAVSGVSVRRPVVANSVWQYGQGARL